MGMTYEQYWDGNPAIAVAYRKAYKLKREIENENAWLQGFYFYDAVSVCLSNFGSKPNSVKKKYIDKPVDIFPLTEEQKKKREQAEYAKMQKTMEQMMARQRAKKAIKGD